MKIAVVVPYPIEESGVITFAFRLCNELEKNGITSNLYIIGENKEPTTLQTYTFQSFEELSKTLHSYIDEYHLIFFMGFALNTSDFQNQITFMKIISKTTSIEIFLMWERTGNDEDLFGLNKNCLNSLRIKGIFVLNSIHQCFLIANVPFQIYLVSPGVDTQNQFFPIRNKKTKIALRKILKWPEDFEILLSVGRFSRRKATDFLIDSWLSSNSRDSTTLILYGSGFHRSDSIEPEVRNLAKLSNNIKIIPYQYGLERAPFYQASDIFISTSNSEGEPIVLSEAMSCGLPIIATDIPGHNRLVIPNKTGILIPKNNKNELIEAIEFLSKNESLRTQLGKNGREKIIIERDISKIANTISTIFLE